MAGNQDQMDQDAIAAQWEASLDSEDPAAAAEEAAANELSESMALQWAAMVEDGGREFGNKNSGERVLSQEEIDNLLGFTVGDVNLDDHSGIRAIIDSAMVSYERLPMLEIVFDRLVRLMTTSLRNFTSDNVEVSLDRITSVRFGDYMNSIPVPAVVAGDVLDRPAGNQSALRRDLKARQRRDSGAAAHRHGRPRRQYRIAAALRDHRADPPGSAPDVHGRKVRPRSDLGRTFRD